MVALLLLVGSASGVAAGEQWCEVDPLVVITTPGGSSVPIFATNGAQGLEHLVALETAHISYTVTAAEGGTATVVTMQVLIAGDPFESHFETRSITSTGPLKTGTVLATARGYSGQVMHMQFKLNVP
jgi:hypothetical protein